MSDSPSSPCGRVLFIEDDADVRAAAELLLRRHGWRMAGAANPAEAWAALAAEPAEVILLDLNFSRGATSGEEGLRCLDALVAADPDAVVVVVTGHSGINVAVAAMRAGAADFVMKPWSNDRLMATLSDALALRRRRVRAAGSEDAGDRAETVEIILGDSPEIDRVRRLIQRAGPTGAAVLIHGGPGAGKDLVARALHRASGQGGTLLKIDLVSQAPDAVDLVLQAPAEATVLLDELGELDPALQDRLLAALDRRGDLRLISTSRVSPAALAGGRLRQDLLYRLNTIEIEIAPLRDRPGDVRLLARYYLDLFARRHGRPARALSEAAAAALTVAVWPGGVRELRTCMERAVLLSDAEVFEPADFDLGPRAREVAAAPPPSLAQSERTLVEAALSRHSFNVSRAAADLGLTRAALYRRMAKHGL